MAGVSLQGIGKRFGSQEVIRSLDLEIEDAELMVLVGPSGCGKSTVLRMIAGLEEVSAGKILIGGQDVTELAPGARNVAMVFQSYALYPHMTVRENLEFGLRMRRVARGERARAVTEVATLLEIDHLLERKPRQLSGGQRQRVALGRAIVRQPAVFLFDEPLSNLDARLRTQTRVEIARLQRQLGTTSIYVTHDQIEAMTLGHRIAVLNEGLLEQVGTPSDLYDRPATTFVATFIGSPPMALLPAAVVEGGFDAGAVQLVGAAQWGGLNLAPGQRVVVGVRPESVREVGHLPGERAARVDGEVELIEPIGAFNHVRLRIAELRLAAMLPPTNRSRIGDRLSLEVDLAALHVFDSATGCRLDA